MCIIHLHKDETWRPSLQTWLGQRWEQRGKKRSCQIATAQERITVMADDDFQALGFMRSLETQTEQKTPDLSLCASETEWPNVAHRIRTFKGGRRECGRKDSSLLWQHNRSPFKGRERKWGTRQRKKRWDNSHFNGGWERLRLREISRARQN